MARKYEPEVVEGMIGRRLQNTYGENVVYTGATDELANERV